MALDVGKVWSTRLVGRFMVVLLAEKALAKVA